MDIKNEDTLCEVEYTITPLEGWSHILEVDWKFAVPDFSEEGTEIK